MPTKKERKKEKSRWSMRGLIEACVCLVEGKLIFDIRAFGLGAVFRACDDPIGTNWTFVGDWMGKI